jgi:PAS domain S-box-containing protein
MILSDYLTSAQQIAYLAVVAVPAVVAGAFKAHQALRLRAQRVVELHSKVDTILKELTPNGGGSIKDAVTSMREDVRKLKTNVAVLRDGLRFSLGLQPTAVFETDAHGLCTNASPALCDMFGKTHEEMIGLGWLAAIHSAEERDRAWVNWRSAVESGVPYKDRYLIHNEKTGERFYAESRAVASKTDDGKVAYFFGSVEKEQPVSTAIRESLSRLDALSHGH